LFNEFFQLFKLLLDSSTFTFRLLLVGFNENLSHSFLFFRLSSRLFGTLFLRCFLLFFLFGSQAGLLLDARFFSFLSSKALCFFFLFDGQLLLLLLGQLAAGGCLARSTGFQRFFFLLFRLLQLLELLEQVLLFLLEAIDFFVEEFLSFFDMFSHLRVGTRIDSIQKRRNLTINVEQLALVVAKLHGDI